jgi:hypothetical protein
MPNASLLKLVLIALLAVLGAMALALMLLASRLRSAKRTLDRVRRERDDFQLLYWRQVEDGGAD